jgi:hypothetical protein
MIFIDQKKFISQGKTRVCYEHPNNTNLCIKIMKLEHENAEFLKKEIRYYKKIQKKNKNYALTFFANYYGTIETNLGTGYLYDLIRDHNGKISLPLKSYLKQKNISDFPNNHAKNALENIKKKMIHYKVFGYDVYHENLLCKIKNQTEIELVLVDGLGITSQSDTIKSRLAFLVNYSDYLAKIRVEKVFRQLSNILDQANKN